MASPEILNREAQVHTAAGDYNNRGELLKALDPSQAEAQFVRFSEREIVSWPESQAEPQVEPDDFSEFFGVGPVINRVFQQSGVTLIGLAEMSDQDLVGVLLSDEATKKVIGLNKNNFNVWRETATTMTKSVLEASQG